MKPIIYTASCGENITESVRESLKLSICKGRDVQFTFNGIDMVVNAKVSLDTSHWTKVFYDATDERSRLYRESDEYKERQRVAEIELATNQAVVNELVFRLPEFNKEQLDDWLIKFIPLSDRIGITYDSTKVTKALIGFGYISGEFVGYTGEWTNNMKKRWAYGQVLDGLSKNMIHPILADHIAEYKQENELCTTTK